MTGDHGQDDLALARRRGLPDALRVLTAELPRLSWRAHPEFDGLARFWLDRHLVFRELSERLRRDVQARIDGNLPPETLAVRVSRLGGALVGGLQEHHTVEDSHYFPVLRQLDTRLERGFDLLDADHHALDARLHDLTDAANAVLRSGAREAAAAFLSETERFEPLLLRHLEDEEDIIVPVLLRAGLR